jgi:dipeptidyl-peptidase-4
MWVPSENALNYHKSAPQNHVESLRARWLIIHGLGDDNVHPQNTIQLVDRLNKANKSYYVLLYPNQTHGVSGQAQIHQYNSMLTFLLENL